MASTYCEIMSMKFDYIDISQPAQRRLPIEGARSIGRAGPWLEAPVSRKGIQARVESHLPRPCIMMLDERLGIVDQHLRRNAAKPQEGAFHLLEPVCIALPERPIEMNAVLRASPEYMEEKLAGSR